MQIRRSNKTPIREPVGLLKNPSQIKYFRYGSLTMRMLVIGASIYWDMIGEFMFGFGKAKLFQTHQTLLYQCMHFGEFALGLAQENADEDQIEFWEAKLARMTKLRDASLRKNGILDKEDGYFLEALREKCEEVFYKTELSKQQSFDDTFIPDGGWEDHFEDIRSNF